MIGTGGIVGTDSSAAPTAPPLAASSPREQASPDMLTFARVNAGRMGMVGIMVLAQRKVLILAADDFEDMELLYPL